MHKNQIIDDLIALVITADTIFPTPKWYIFTRLMLCIVSMIALILTTT